MGAICSGLEVTQVMRYNVYQEIFGDILARIGFHLLTELFKSFGIGTIINEMVNIPFDCFPMSDVIG